MTEREKKECLHNLPLDFDPKTVMTIACGHLLTHEQLLARQAKALRKTASS
jgi:hypothetical protein